MYWLKTCPRCRGDLYASRNIYGHFVQCLQCGYELSDQARALLLRSGRLETRFSTYKRLTPTLLPGPGELYHRRGQSL